MTEKRKEKERKAKGKKNKNGLEQIAKLNLFS